MSETKYSICMLCSNNVDTVEKSLTSLVDLRNSISLEIVVCDNMSTDGSNSKLKKFEEAGKIKLVSQKCTRGKGRQRAFELSRGSYILGHMDCDDLFNREGVLALVDLYHKKYEGRMMMTRKPDFTSSNITIATRDLISDIGGWRDLNWIEDWDLWERADEIGAYTFAPYPDSLPPHRTIRASANERNKSLLSKSRVRLGKYYDSFRIGRYPFSSGEHISLGQKTMCEIAKTAVFLNNSKLPPVVNPKFVDTTITSH